MRAEGLLLGLWMGCGNWAAAGKLRGEREEDEGGGGDISDEGEEMEYE